MIIERYLEEANIEYKRQYPISVDSSISQSRLAYIDFYLPKYNLFVEYNGR